NLPNGSVYLVLMDCSFPLFEEFSGVASHEMVEAITDRAPTPGDIPDFPQAWNDSRAFETADICEDLAGSSVPTPTGTFPVSYIWDEAGGACNVFPAFAQDYNVSLATPAADLQAGQAITVAVNTMTTNGAAQPLTLTATAPAGIAASFDRTTIQSGE